MKKIFTTLLLFFVAGSGFAIDHAAQTNASFIVFSDVHFDPFYGCTVSLRPCPLLSELKAAPVSKWASILHASPAQRRLAASVTDFALLQSSLNAIKEQAKSSHAKFAVVDGDFLGHKFLTRYELYSKDYSVADYQNFVDKTLSFIVLEIDKALPDLPVFAVIGNNDSYGGSYYVNSQDNFFAHSSKIFSRLLPPDEAESLVNNFTQAGYYSVNTSPEIKLIFLNSTLFAKLAHGEAVKRLAENQMQWLKDTLKQARQSRQKVWLFLHIPPGIDAYKVVTHPLKDNVAFWHEGYAQSYLKLMQQYSAIIKGNIAGHLHMDGFMLSPVSKNFFISLVPAISPIYGNRPAFKLYHYDSAAELTDFSTFYMNKEENWAKEYDFNQTYQPDCSYCKLQAGMLALRYDGPLAANYRHYYAVSTQSQPIKELSNWPYYWCASQNLLVANYEQCLSQLKYGDSTISISHKLQNTAINYFDHLYQSLHASIPPR